MKKTKVVTKLITVSITRLSMTTSAMLHRRKSARRCSAQTPMERITAEISSE